MSEDIQTQFRQEGEPAFNTDTENDNSADSSSDQTDINQTPAPGEDNNTDANNQSGNDNPDDQKKDDNNLADHPRWKERENDWTKRFNEQETRHTGELAKLRQEFEEKLKGFAPKTESNQPVQMPSWFGGTEEQWNDFQKWNQDAIAQAKSDAVKEIEAKSGAEQKAIEEATTYMNNEVVAIEADKELNPTGAKIDKNKLLKIVSDFNLVDLEGKWNYRAGWAFLRNQIASQNNNGKNVVNEKKTIAGASITEKRTDTKPQPFMTSEDFQKPGNRPW